MNEKLLGKTFVNDDLDALKQVDESKSNHNVRNCFEFMKSKLCSIQKNDSQESGVSTDLDNHSTTISNLLD